MYRMYEVNHHRGYGNDADPDETRAEKEHQKAVNGVDCQIRQPEPRRPSFPDRVIDGQGKNSEWPVNTLILLLRPVWRLKELDGRDGTNCCIRSNQRSVIENEFVRQGIQVANGDNDNR
jgi:hypothetical protein